MVMFPPSFCSVQDSGQRNSCPISFDLWDATGLSAESYTYIKLLYDLAYGALNYAKNSPLPCLSSPGEDTEY